MNKYQKLPDYCTGCGEPLTCCNFSCLSGVLHKFLVEIDIPTHDIIFQIMNGSIVEATGRNRLVPLEAKSAVMLDYVLNEFTDNPESGSVIELMLKVNIFLNKFACESNKPTKETTKVEAEFGGKVKVGKNNASEDGAEVGIEEVVMAKLGAELGPGEVVMAEVGVELGTEKLGEVVVLAESKIKTREVEANRKVGTLGAKREIEDDVVADEKFRENEEIGGVVVKGEDKVETKEVEAEKGEGAEGKLEENGVGADEVRSEEESEAGGEMGADEVKEKDEMGTKVVGSERDGEEAGAIEIKAKEVGAEIVRKKRSRRKK